MPMDEAQLIRRAQRGDREAIAAIYDCCYAALFTYIYYRVSDQECAEDLTTEAFIRMIAMLPGYVDQGKPLICWLYTIAHNLVIDHYRAKTIETMPLDESLIGNDGKHPAEVQEEHEAQEDLARAMKQLTEEQRQVIQLKFIEDYDIRRVAVILGRNERTIRSLQHRALAALSRIMQRETSYEP